jgi:hypothetical protein
MSRAKTTQTRYVGYMPHPVTGLPFCPTGAPFHGGGFGALECQPVGTPEALYIPQRRNLRGCGGEPGSQWAMPLWCACGFMDALILDRRW